MQLFKTSAGLILQRNEAHFILHEDFDALINRDDLFEYLTSVSSGKTSVNWNEIKILAPIGKQEVWAAGVTYLRSRDARMEESKEAGGAVFYSKVYNAARPELFFKALPYSVASPGEEVFIRADSKWNVPEPELTLFINTKGKIAAYTIGNDMSSRDIEGENPLYLPQAKLYYRSAALGPCLYITEKEISLDTAIHLSIKRNEEAVFEGSIQLNRMKRRFTELAEYLFRENIFTHGCFLMTGTGIIPPNDFTLQSGDEVEIGIENIGVLANVVAYRI
ncbi:fumarylacetoacetate hydrolase family protein [Parafilimonas sp.]|uniref:fumarylacetoacetate hydrolase family protein n=1 Tax=Parafilimonas sp. TaxID=1969739 RepID=UPI0039E4E5B7